MTETPGPEQYAHLVVANVIDGGLTMCGVVIPFREPGAPNAGATLPRCPACGTASEEAAQRKQARQKAGMKS